MTEEKTGRPYDKYAHRSQYVNEYEKTRVKQINLSLNRNTDADIIAHLEQQPNVRRYLIELIQADMAK